MGGVRQKAIRWTRTGSQVFGALHTPRGHLQQPAPIAGKWPGHLQWKDYADGNQSKTMTLDAVEFIRRFLLHVLPSGFVRIRHFGFLANRNRKEKLVLAAPCCLPGKLPPSPARV